MLDQPGEELGRLEAVLLAFADYEELEARRLSARNSNKERHKKPN